jgi:hypothetical protein
VEDDHVDRPGVEERQRLKLTGTNSSIGLIVLITHIHQGAIRRIVATLTHACSALTGGATWVRRNSADGRSTLRSFASKGARLKGTSKAQQRPANSLEKAANGVPYWLLTIGYSLKKLLDLNVRFADLVVMAERLHPIPFRTRP